MMTSQSGGGEASPIYSTCKVGAETGPAIQPEVMGSSLFDALFLSNHMSRLSGRAAPGVSDRRFSTGVIENASVSHTPISSGSSWPSLGNMTSGNMSSGNMSSGIDLPVHRSCSTLSTSNDAIMASWPSSLSSLSTTSGREESPCMGNSLDWNIGCDTRASAGQGPSFRQSGSESYTAISEDWQAAPSPMGRMPVSSPSVRSLPSDNMFMYQSPGTIPASGGEMPFQALNNSCFEAAISDNGLPSDRSGLVAKLRNLKQQPHQRPFLTNKNISHCQQQQQHLHHQHERQPLNHQQQQLQQQQQQQGQLAENRVTSVNLFCMKQTFSNFTCPSIPSLSTTCSNSQTSVGLSRSDKSFTEKYRYSQTALALQQSGLMKTTIKTAELLRKSRVLQQELKKLQQDTAVLVCAVLDNPQNRHIKESYLTNSKQSNPS